MKKYDNRPDKRPSNFTRVNFQIRCPNVRVVRDGEQLGIMPTDQARRLAQDAGFDLVEIAANANPPVCHIIEYDKYRYQQKQKEKDQRRNQRTSEIKELRLRPGIQANDIETKVKAAVRFLEEGKKVQFNLQYKNRELAHKDEGFRVMNKIIADTAGIASVERAPKMEGNRLVCRLEPKMETISAKDTGSGDGSPGVHSGKDGIQRSH